MRKTIYLLCAISVFLIGLTACQENSRIMTKNYTVSSFNAIKSKVVGNIVFAQSNEVAVSVEGSESLVKNLVVEVENGTLNLSFEDEIIENSFFPLKNKRLTIHVSAPNIGNINMDGVGNLKFEGSVKSDTLFVKMKGVGNIEVEELENKFLSIESKGVGNISLSGNGQTVNLNSEDVGNIDAEDFLAKNVTIHSSGVGNINCYASDSIEIHGSGVGNITYYGNPTSKNIDKSGVGKVNAGD